MKFKTFDAVLRTVSHVSLVIVSLVIAGTILNHLNGLDPQQLKRLGNYLWIGISCLMSFILGYNANAIAEYEGFKPSTRFAINVNVFVWSISFILPYGLV